MSLLLISTLDGQKSVWDNANDIGDKAMLHKIRCPDNKCTDMVADYCQYHRVCMNSYLTRRVHSHEKACPSTHTSPCDAVMTQLVSCLDESFFRDGAIFFVTFLRNEFWKSLETHMEWTMLNPEMKVSYFEASQRMSCNMSTHLAWLITDASLRWVMMACQSQTIRTSSQPCPRCLPSGCRLSNTKAHRNSFAPPKENRTKATVPL